MGGGEQHMGCLGGGILVLGLRGAFIGIHHITK